MATCRYTSQDHSLLVTCQRRHSSSIPSLSTLSKTPTMWLKRPLVKTWRKLVRWRHKGARSSISSMRQTRVLILGNRRFLKRVRGALTLRDILKTRSVLTQPHLNEMSYSKLLIIIMWWAKRLWVAKCQNTFSQTVKVRKLKARQAYGRGSEFLRNFYSYREIYSNWAKLDPKLGRKTIKCGE